MAKRRVVVGRVGEIEPGGVKIVPEGKFGVGVYNVNGEYFALTNYCPHRGAPLCRGVVTGMTEASTPYESAWVREGEILRCPWHGWEFAIKDGTTVTEPKRQVKTFAVVVEGDTIMLETSGASDD
jgi:nitrite reductase/ring-hydroxylating ferredoxin subunit